MIGVLFAAALSAQAAAAIESALRAPTLRGAHVGFYAVDRSSGDVLYARNADDDFVPASTLKLLTGSVAMAREGASFTYETNVEAAGAVVSGTLDGDLVLRGGGDAQLSAQDLDAAAAAVASKGIRRVRGALIGDPSRYDAPRYPGGWAVDDVPYGYAAVPGALLLQLGVTRVRILPGRSAGMPAVLQTDASTSAFRIENATQTGTTGSDDTTDVERSWKDPRTIRIVGSYPLGAPLSDDLEPSVPDPAEYAVQAFGLALQRHGVEILDGVRLGPEARVAGSSTLWTHRSKPLAQILADCWVHSVNVLAEQMLLELGTHSIGPARSAVLSEQSESNGQGDSGGRQGDTREAGIAVERQWLQSIGIDPATVTIADGSGLSAYDRITPRDLVTVLDADFASNDRDAFVSALPVAGSSGTLERTFTGTPLAGNVIAKTGSENHARLLAGFVKRADGGAITFALMVNDWMDDSPSAETALNEARAAMLESLRTSQV